ncbi:MAG: hypothetical protein ACSHX7_14435, partial [Luteolibacter sp.]
MRTSLFLSVLILVGATAIGWYDYQRLIPARRAHSHAVTEATKRGISLNPSNEAATSRITKRKREDPEATIKLLAVDYIGFAKEKEARRNSHSESDIAFQQRELDFDERIKALAPKQWKSLISEICACEELKNRTRHAFLYNSITGFARKHPQSALAFLADSPDLFTDIHKAEHLVSTALIGWTEDDPLAAMKWIRENKANHSNLINERAKRDMVIFAAMQDPHLGFEFIRGLNVESANLIIGDLLGLATTPEKRTATLAAFRDHLATIKDDKIREEITMTARAFLHTLVGEDFNSSSKWIAGVNMTPLELESLAEGLASGAIKSETGKWIEWIGENLPNDKAAPRIHNMIRNWTLRDYESAGKWLTTFPEGTT